MNKEKNHHAKFSPSNSKRWLTCTSSMLLPGVEERGPSEFAERGTALHEAAEDILSGKELKDDYNGYVPTAEDMEETVIPYVEYVLELPADLKLIEQKIKLSDECYGTADCIAYDAEKKTVHVIDLKAGKGIFVYAKGNTQLQIYAIGALALLAERGITEIEKVVTHIVQPGIGNFGFENVELETLAALRTQVLQTIAKVNGGEGEYKPSGDACQFCAHKVTCPELVKVANKAAKNDFAGFDLSEKMLMIPALKRFIKGVEDESLKVLNQGKEVPGFKLVRSLGNRKFKNEEEVEKALLASDVKDLSPFRTPGKLKSVAQVEKVLKKNKIELDLAALVERKEGAPKVAAADSSADAIDKTAEAKAAFKGA